MGKFGDDRDKIVGEGSYENHSSVRLSGKALSKTKKSPRTLPYFSDSLLIPRINEYLAENKEKVYIDINEMVNDLQSRYREYGRRKKYAFRQSVQKAFNTVLRQCGINQEIAEQGDEYVDSTDNSSSDVEECNVGENYEAFKTSSNNQIINLYTPKRLQTSKNVQKSPSQNAELIDLSSDDENVKKKDENEENVKKKDENEENVTKEAKNNCLPNHSLLKENLSAPISKLQNKTGKAEKVSIPSRKRKLGSHSGKLNYITKQKRLMFQEPKVTFADFGGNTKALEEVCKLILHIQHPEFYRRLGLSSPRGFLLHGPPGCGKTLLASAIAGELNVHFLKVSAPELVGGVSGESEERIRELFESAVESAPCVLFIDEVDAITPNRQNAQREMERRIVAQLLTCLDELNNMPNGDQVLVIGATNRPDSLDPALRRAGRFDREVCLGIPDLKAREQILRVLCKDLRMSQNFSYEEIAVNTPGFVGADLLSLTREAAMIAFNRVFGTLFKNTEDKQMKKKKMKLENDESRSDTVKRGSLFNKINNDSRDCWSKNTLPSEKMDTGSSPVIPKLQNERTGEGMSYSIDCGTGSSLASEKMDTDSSPVIPKTQNERIGEEIPDGRNSINVNSGGEAQSTNLNLNAMDAENEKREEKEKEKATSDKEVGGTISEESLNCGDIEICKDDSVKTVGSDDESEVEVLAACYDPEPPNLTTLLYWIRCTPPLTFDELENLFLTQDDFNQALRCVQPSAKREGFATVPDVTWNDIGSLADVREELKMSVLGPVKMRKQFEQLGLTAPSGILICGPPGCGKTLLAKAVANEAGINFISVKGPELLNMYVGESERAVRQCFQRARNSAPCVIFFDELDALCPKRSGSGENVASSRVVNQMLTEMDGVEDRKEVYLMAATNRPDIVDPAVLRPGRLDKIMYVGLPEEDGRIDILKALTKNGTRPKLASDVNLVNIAKRPECNGYSGADLAALVREAGVQALKDLLVKNDTNAESQVQVSMVHFERALNKIRPSVSSEDRVYYEHMRKKYCFSDSSSLSP